MATISSASSAPRKKILDRLKKLLARSKSSNEHEARLSRDLADEFIQKHGITEDELQELSRPLPSRRYAGRAFTEKWQEAFAVAVGKRYACRAMGAKGHVFFEGVESVEAAAQFKKIVGAIEEAQEEWIGSQAAGLHALWIPIFCGAASSAALRPEISMDKRELHTVSQQVLSACRQRYASYTVERCIEEGNHVGHQIGLRIAQGEVVSGTGLSGRTFSRFGGLISVFDTRPGNFATLFLNEKKLAFRGDLSVFDNTKQMYTWVFGQVSELDTGTQVVFVTADKEIVGEVRGQEIRRTTKVARVARSFEGEPLYVERIES